MTHIPETPVRYPVDSELPSEGTVLSRPPHLPFSLNHFLYFIVCFSSQCPSLSSLHQYSLLLLSLVIQVTCDSVCILSHQLASICVSPWIFYDLFHIFFYHSVLTSHYFWPPLSLCSLSLSLSLWRCQSLKKALVVPIVLIMINITFVMWQNYHKDI